MLSSHNEKEQLRKHNPSQQHFTLKKLTVGVSSVLIGLTFMGMKASADNTQSTPSNEDDNTNTNLTQSGESLANEQVHVFRNGQSNQSGQNGQNVPATYKTSPAESPEGPSYGPEDPSQPGPGPSDENLEKEAKVLPQVAIQGEVPSLDPQALVNKAYQQFHNLSSDPNDWTCTWTKLPDVSSLGETSGTATLSDGEHTLNLNIPVKVVAGNKKAANQVRNTLNIIEKDSNKVLYHFTWLGTPSEQTDSEDSQQEGLNKYNLQLAKVIKYLGFQDDPENGSDLNDLIYKCSSFGDHDKTWSAIVVPVDQDAYKNHKIVVAGSEDTDRDTTDLVTSLDHIDPAAFVYGLGYLPADATVEWGTKPEWKMDDDTLSVTNDPTIQVVENGKIIQTLSGNELKDAISLKLYNSIQSLSNTVANKGTLTITQNSNVPSADTVISSIPYETDENENITTSDGQDPITLINQDDLHPKNTTSHVTTGQETTNDGVITTTTTTSKNQDGTTTTIVKTVSSSGDDPTQTTTITDQNNRTLVKKVEGEGGTTTEMFTDDGNVITQTSDNQSEMTTPTGHVLPITDPETVKNILGHFNVNWLIKPDSSQLGYQIGYFEISKKDSSDADFTQNFTFNGQTVQRHMTLDTINDHLNPTLYSVLVHVVPAIHNYHQNVIYQDRQGNIIDTAKDIITGQFSDGTPAHVTADQLKAAINGHVPANWKIVSDYAYPESETINTTTPSAIIVTIEHATQDIKPNNPNVTPTNPQEDKQKPVQNTDHNGTSSVATSTQRSAVKTGNQNSQQSLPQTGNHQSTSVIALGMTALMASLGLINLKKKDRK